MWINKLLLHFNSTMLTFQCFHQINLPTCNGDSCVIERTVSALSVDSIFKCEKLTNFMI